MNPILSLTFQNSKKYPGFRQKDADARIKSFILLLLQNGNSSSDIPVSPQEGEIRHT